jgi:hypothetical protein
LVERFELSIVEPLAAEPLSVLTELSEVEDEVETEDPLLAEPLSAVELFELSEVSV